MRFFHLHDWTKWEEYDQEFSKYHPPMSNSNWYGYTESWSEKWEKRECKLCGKKQRRKVKSDFYWGDHNVKVDFAKKEK